MPWTNYHSHTHYCDGNGTVNEYIETAIALGMPAYGITSHAPVNFETVWCIPDLKFESYLKEVQDAKKKFAGKIEIYLGLEIDFIPGVAGRKRHLLASTSIDYFIGSVHFVGKFEDGSWWNIDHTRELFDKGLKEIYRNNFEKASEAFYNATVQMLEEDKPDVIGHLDKIKMYNSGNFYFNESDKFYRNQIESVLSAIKKSGAIVEVNTRGYYRYGQKELYPGPFILEKLAKMDIPVMLNSDSHSTGEIISGFDYAIKILKDAGIQKLWALIGKRWQAFDYNEQGLIL